MKSEIYITHDQVNVKIVFIYECKEICYVAIQALLHQI